MNIRSASGRALRFLVLFQALYQLSVIGAVLLWPVSREAEIFHSERQTWTPEGYLTFESHFTSWDAKHYLHVSEVGYQAGSPACAFYPLWPIAVPVLFSSGRGQPRPWGNDSRELGLPRRIPSSFPNGRTTMWRVCGLACVVLLIGIPWLAFFSFHLLRGPVLPPADAGLPGIGRESLSSRPRGRLPAAYDPGRRSLLHCPHSVALGNSQASSYTLAAASQSQVGQISFWAPPTGAVASTIKRTGHAGFRAAVLPGARSAAGRMDGVFAVDVELDWKPVCGFRCSKALGSAIHRQPHRHPEIRPGLFQPNDSA